MRFFQPTKAQEEGFRKWVRRLPKKARKIAERFNPWTLYRLKDTGHKVVISGFNDDGTVSAIVSAEFNLVLHQRHVFGIPPDKLEECDLPAADEPVGAALTQAQVEENLDALRVIIRPDLWVMQDGKAVRKQ